MLIKHVMNLLGLIKKVADSLIVVKSINDICNVLAHINLRVPLSCKELRLSVNKVGSEDSCKYAISVSLIDSLVAVAEETEGGEYEDSLSALVLKLLSNVKNGLAGGDHIINDDNILALNVSAEVLVSYDGVLAVNDNGIIAALVEHTEVDSENGGIVHTLTHTALIGRNDHSGLGIYIKIRVFTQKSLDHLICRSNILKSGKRNSVLHSGIVSVECDEVEILPIFPALNSSRSMVAVRS